MSALIALHLLTAFVVLLLIVGAYHLGRHDEALHRELQNWLALDRAEFEAQVHRYLSHP